MKIVDDVLYEFKGELTLQDIYSMTWKELGYLRQARHARLEAMAKNPTSQASMEEAFRPG